MVATQSKLVKAKGKLHASATEIEILDENTDLEITIEGSDHLYGSIIYITHEDHADNSQTNDDDDRGMTKLLGKVFGHRNKLQPVHISSPKHMTKFRFINLSPGKYNV